MPKKTTYLQKVRDAVIRLVDAGKHDRHNTPVSVPINPPADAKSVVLVAKDGTQIPGQLRTGPPHANAVVDRAPFRRVYQVADHDLRALPLEIVYQV